MSKRKLVVFATDFERTKEADEVFARRGWRLTQDNSQPLPGKRLVNRERKETPIMDVEIEEWEYGGESHD